MTAVEMVRVTLPDMLAAPGTNKETKYSTSDKIGNHGQSKSLLLFKYSIEGNESKTGHPS